MMGNTMISQIKELVKREKMLARELADIRAKLGSIRMALWLTLSDVADDRADGPYGEAYVGLPEMIHSALTTHGVLDTTGLLLIVNQVRPIERSYLQSCLSKMTKAGKLVRVGMGTFELAASPDIGDNRIPADDAGRGVGDTSDGATP